MNRPITYPGGKIGSGSFQQIMNEIPADVDTIVIPFLGNCPIARYFRGRIKVIAFELYPVVINDYWDPVVSTDFEILNEDCLTWLRSHIHLLGPATFIYADPPYLFSTRKGGKLYNYEFGTDKEHADLVQLLLTTRSRVAISGYESGLYNDLLGNWRKKKWQVATRGGKATETLWMNYDTPDRLYTYDFLGRNNTERQRIKRKIERHVKRLKRLPHHEAMAIIDKINCTAVDV